MEAIAYLVENDEVFKKLHQQYGNPYIPSRPEGFQTLCKLILEQQVSVDSAKATFTKLKTTIPDFIPENVNAILGENLFGSYISGVQHLDGSDTTYEYDTDITLDPGQYRVIFDPKIISANSENAVTIIINTTVIGAPGDSLEFTVN